MWSRIAFSLLSVLLASGALAAEAPLDVTFFVTSDTHVCTGRDGISPAVAKGHVWAMNNATGDGPNGKLVWPAGLPSSGKRIQDPRFVLLAGDIADDRVYDLDKPSSGNPVWGNCWNLVQELYSGSPSYRKPWSSRFPVYLAFGTTTGPTTTAGRKAATAEGTRPLRIARTGCSAVWCRTARRETASPGCTG